MHMYLKCLLYIFLFVFILPAPCLSAQLYNIGFRTMGVWNPESRMRFDFNVWYPTKRAPQLVNFSRWSINVANNAKPAEGIFPLLLISHPSPGGRFSYNYLASYFTGRGFIVVAPEHSGDSMDNMDDLFTWQQLSRRVLEIKSTLDLVLEDKIFSPHIDASRIALIGFGSGAAASLLLCGAKPNCSQWPLYCPRAGYNDVYCSPWARERINNLCNNFPIPSSLMDKRLKAVVLIAPAFGMLFTRESVAEVNIPILLVGAGMDNFNRADMHCEPLARILGKKASYLDLPKADAGALMGACSQQLESELPELCFSVSNEERKIIHQQLENALSTFLGKYMGVNK